MLSTARIPHTPEGIPFREGHRQEFENMKRLDIVVNHPTLLVPDTRRRNMLHDQTVTHPSVHSGRFLGQLGGNHIELATREVGAATASENNIRNMQHAHDHNMELCLMVFEIQRKWGQRIHSMLKSITKRMNDINNASLLPK